MAAELRDLRIRVTLETYVALQAHARAFDQDLSEIARELLDAWAVKKMHEHTVYGALLRAEGLSATHKGARAATEGDVGDSQGSPGKGARR